MTQGVSTSRPCPQPYIGLSLRAVHPDTTPREAVGICRPLLAHNLLSESELCNLQAYPGPQRPDMGHMAPGLGASMPPHMVGQQPPGQMPHAAVPSSGERQVLRAAMRMEGPCLLGMGKSFVLDIVEKSAVAPMRMPRLLLLVKHDMLPPACSCNNAIEWHETSLFRCHAAVPSKAQQHDKVSYFVMNA